MLNKTIKILLIIVVFFEVVYGSELDLKSERYIIYNMNDNVILDEKDSHDEVSIASLTKIMTIIVAIENIEDFNKKITIKNSMIKDIAWDVATVGFKVGEKVTYNDLLYGAMLSSGADAVNALAESVSGNRKDFVALMNKKVEDLNLENTHFENVVGLYSKNNYSSAYDMAQILIYSLKNKKFKEVFEAKNYKLSNGKKIRSTIEKYNDKNKKNISYITGSKTGYISKAGFCLASTATLNDVHYLLVTLNAFSSEYNVHINDHIKAYNYYNDNYSYKNVVDEDDVVVTLDTRYSKEKTVDIKAGTHINKYVKNDFDKSKIEFEYDGQQHVYYNIKNGSKLGKIKVKYDGNEIDEFDLLFHGTLTFSLSAYLWENRVLLTIIILFTFLILYTKGFKNRKKQNKNN